MKIIVQNIVTEYQDEGTGPVLLFLHGWQNNLHTFDLLAPLLADRRRIIRVDLPGFGGSELPKKTWGLDNYVRFVSDFINKLDIRINTLVGHSFGGRIAIKGQATKSFQAEKVVLIASAGVSQKRILRNLFFKILVKFGGLVTFIPPLIFWREKLRRKIYDQIGSDYFKAGALRETFLKIVKEDLSAIAGNITTPVLLIWGADDTETPLSDGQRLSKLIHGSILKVINGAGHFVHQERPKEVANLIREFL